MEIEDMAMGNENIAEESEANLVLKAESSAPLAKQIRFHELSEDEYTCGEHASPTRVSKRISPSASFDGGPSGVTGCQGAPPTPGPPALRMRHPKGFPSITLRKNYDSVSRDTPNPRRRASRFPLLAYLLFAIVTALLTFIVFIHPEEWWWIVRCLEDTTSIAISRLFNNENASLSASLLPPVPLSFAPGSATIFKEVKPTGTSTRVHTLPSTPERYCFTLEEYSIHFIASDRQNRDHRRFFRCGTRVVDLRTETRSSVLAACSNATPAPFHDPATVLPSRPGEENKIFGNREAGSAAVSSLAYLRVVLTEKELIWHRQHRHNAASQCIPLDRFNDDYCDCVDGTDELLTNACSMSGPGMALAGTRWKSYLTSNLHTRLYEEQLVDRVHEQLRANSSIDPKNIMAIAEKRVLELRFIELGGPVLPIPCRSDPTMLLAPSLVGDGIVDCCDGSDEGIGSEKEDGDAFFRGMKISAVEVEWRSRRASLASYLSISLSDDTGPRYASRRTPDFHGQPQTGRKSAYWDSLHPYYTSAAAVLVEKGYGSLLSCSVVDRQRLERAEIVLNFVRRGHRVQRVRSLQGWEALGRFLVENRSILMGFLNNATSEASELQHQIQSQMENKRVFDPIKAGVPEEQLFRYRKLQERINYLNQEHMYLSTILSQGVFGKHFEYYPLYTKKLTISATRVMRSDYPAAGMRHGRKASRRVRMADFHRPGGLLREGGLPPHVDNVTLVQLAVDTTRALVATQWFDVEAEGRLVAGALGLLPPGEEYRPGVFRQPHVDPFRTHPIFSLGHWQPFATADAGASMNLVDPAGDADLPRRGLVRPLSLLHRGGGRLQWPTRILEKIRFLKFPDETRESGRQRILSSVGAKEREEIAIPVLHHANTPNRVAAHVYKASDLRCEPDPPLSTKWNPEDDPHKSHSDIYSGRKRGQSHEPLHRTQSALVSYMCHTGDEILLWALNGKCHQEVVVGTPSACTQWVLKEAERQVRVYKKAAREEGHMNTVPIEESFSQE